MDPEELFLMSDGRVFQSVGAATEKDLALYVLINLECRKERSFLMLNLADEMEVTYMSRL